MKLVLDRQVSEFIEQVHTELVSNLLPFWISNAVDHEGGGIHGRISNELVVDRTAPRSLVLVTRSLWTFSAAAIFFDDPEYLAVAHGTHDYFIRHFIDKKYGGAYWMLNSSGYPIDNTKKVYGHAFVIYALSEYFKATKNRSVLDQAIDFYHLTETHFGENKYGGYIEAVSRDWSPTTDWRLSMIDVNAMKSMNAHLHLLEAYTNLYSQWSDGGLRERLRELVACFRDHIIDHERHHFHLFFNEEWQLKSRSVSFGHDIEGSWLICKALEVLDDEPLRQVMLDEALAMAEAVMTEGLDQDGGLIYSIQEDGLCDREKIWWTQAEAMVGFLNAYAQSKREEFFKTALSIWEFIKAHHVDREYGEWFYKVSANGKVVREMSKVSEWKGPYHNARSCMKSLRILRDKVSPMKLTESSTKAYEQ